MNQCETVLRTGRCTMHEGHRGRHTTVAFFCDACGNMRRGQPKAQNEDVAICWFCVTVDLPRIEEEYRERAGY